MKNYFCSYRHFTTIFTDLIETVLNKWGKIFSLGLNINNQVIGYFIPLKKLETLFLNKRLKFKSFIGSLRKVQTKKLKNYLT